jgi:Protein of unknown function (DUF3040)
MSLAPRERQALAAIETGLRTADPGFAVTLARLADQLSRGRKPRVKSWLRSLARHRLPIWGVVLVGVATLVIAFGVAAAIVATSPGQGAPRQGHAVVGTTASTNRAMPFGL